VIVDATLPAVVQAYLRAVLVDRAHLLLLSFSLDWQLQAAHGDAAFHGVDVDDAEGTRALRDLFIGLPLDRDQNIPFVELANGRSAHVHLIADAPGFHLLLLDAEDARSQQRAQQQLVHEAVISSQAKSKAIGQLKDIRSELERQRAGLEEANALKNALIATLSHEFRTPLTSIFGYLHLIERRACIDATSQQALQAVRRSATYLFTLAENLLEYGRGEAGGGLLNPVDVDLAALLADIEAMFAPLAEAKGIAFRASLVREDAGVARFDEVKLRQIATNLLSNAIRYTARGEVALSLGWREPRLHVEVRDSGIGIAPEFIDSVFKPFNRGGQAGSKGAGLGLSIVRRLVEQMQGTLAVESEPGRGTCFRAELPSASRQATDARVDDAALRGRRVLVVDDDPDIAQLIEVLLSDLGFVVDLLGDADAALESVMRKAPDVLLIDVELPGLSGNAATYKLRAQGYRGQIVTLSANASADARDASLRAGANHYLTKPLELERFVAVMRQAIEQAADGTAVHVDRA
jgi:signal transduction histidine kinase/ActR/RegA family two-component response regulator